MTVDEIFKKLATHMIQGMMLHEELANYYDFLNLYGYKKCHEYHYYDESCGYRKLYHYYVQHFNKMIQKEKIESKDIISKSWYSHVKSDVDSSLKRQSVQSGVETWVEWEKETKKLYQESFQQLMSLGEVAAACFVKNYIIAVDEELKNAEKKHLNLKATNFDINYIITSQQECYEKYKKMIKEYCVYK